jgi:CheY-like chemotaxis protein
MTEPDRVCVLLVEDSPQDVFLLRAALEKVAGGQFELLHAERLVDALALLKQHRVDLVLTDLNLPDSEGLHTIRELVRQTAGVPIVVLAGCNNPDVPEQWRQAGASGHIAKDRLNSPALSEALTRAQQRRQD